MDFHSLSRKELQTLCKKNKIPANITNVAMADALSALPQVEGLDEFLNPTEAEARIGTGTPETHRTATRPSTRRKALKEEPQSSKVVSSQRPQRGTRKGGNGEGGVAEQENKDANVLLTPAARRRGAAATSRRKKEPEMVEDDEKNEGNGKPTDSYKSPAAVPSSRKTATGRSVCTKTEGTSVQRAYNTRRSVRFLEKNMSKMSLVEAEDARLSKIDDVSEEVSSVSQQIEDSADTTEEGASSEVVSSLVSEETDELEVSSLEKQTEHECQVVSGTENDVGAGLEDEPQHEDLGKVDCLVADSEPHESNLQPEDSSKTLDDSNEVIECCESIVGMNKSTGENVHEQIEAGSELLSELEDSCDSAEAENKDCLGTKQEALSVEASEDASVEFTEQDVAAVTIEVPDDASIEVTEQDVAALSVEASEDASMELNEQDVAVEASEDASMDLTEKDVAALAVEVPDDASVEVTDQDVAGLLAMSPVSDDSARPKELLDHTDHQGSEADVSQEDGSGVESENTEESLAEVEEMDNLSDVIGASSPIASEKVDANSENSIDDVEVCIDSSAEESTNGESVTLESPLLHEDQELEAKSEDLEESMGEVEKIIDGASDVVIGASSATISLEKDANASYENSIAAAENSTESLADVHIESLLVEVDVQEAAEETAFDATSAFCCGLDQTSNPQIPSQVSAEYDEISDSCSSDVSVLSINSNTLVEVDVVSEEDVIPKQEFHVSAETTVTVEPIPELKASHITMQSVVAEQSNGESKGVASETQAVPKMIGVENNMHNAANMKENLTIDELQRKSLRELKKMMKKLTLVDDKPNCKSKTCDNVVKEVERKRTALQALPGNQMTKDEALNDV